MTPTRLAGGLALLLLVSGAQLAWAGRTAFAWLYDVDSLPERGVELDQWLIEENHKGAARVDETTVLWQPVVGLTDQLELALPIELTFEQEAGESATNLERFGAELRWRLVTADPVEAPPVVPLLRLGAKRVVTERGYYRLEPGATVSVQLGRRVRLLADGTAIVKARPDSTKLELRPGGGIQVAVADQILLGGEVYSEIGIDDPSTTTWVAAGPTMSFTHGRFWLTASFPFGITGIDAAPRINWGIAF